ncbi:unnamed protein product [Caenorhabditis brenneri]
MSDKSKEQEDAQKNPQIGTLRSDDDFDLFVETHSAPFSQHVFDEAYHQQDSLFLSGMHQDGETSGVTTSNSFFQTASSSSLFTEEQVNPGNPVPTASSDMQYYASQAPMSSYSNSCMLKKLLLDRQVGNEPSDGYKRGGFCPINVGEVLNGEFVIIKKLGYGGFSTVWMAWHYVLQKYVALKITKSAERFMGMAEEELNYLEVCTIANPNAMGAKNIVQLLTAFTHVSESGSHIAMAFEIHGPSLFDVLYHSNQKFIHLEQVRRICRQLLEAVSFLHDECGIIHSDIKPENIMVAVSDEDIQRMDPKCPVYDSFTQSFDLDFTHPDSDIKIKLGDLGVSCWISKPRYPLLQTNVFRAPEVFFKGIAGTAADMWSVGCVAFELLAGRSLFACNNTKLEIDEVTHHLRQMSEIIGPIPFTPYRFEQNMEFVRLFYDEDGSFINETLYNPNWLVNIIGGLREMTPEDANQCADFIASILKMTPSERPTAKQALNHPFLLPFGGKSQRRVARENFFDYYSHVRHEEADSNIRSWSPIPIEPSSPIQSPDLSGYENESNSGNESPNAIVVESLSSELNNLSMAPSSSQNVNSPHSESPSS